MKGSWNRPSAIAAYVMCVCHFSVGCASAYEAPAS